MFPAILATLQITYKEGYPSVHLHFETTERDRRNEELLCVCCA